MEALKEETMNFLDDPMLFIAVLDLGVAVECLRSLLDVPPAERGVSWAHEVCTYSRYIHINVWTERPSIRYVRKEIVGKLLNKAAREVEVLATLNRFNEVERSEIQHFHKNISLRVENIKNNFLSGRPSDFDPAEEEPSGHVKASNENAT